MRQANSNEHSGMLRSDMVNPLANFCRQLRIRNILFIVVAVETLALMRYAGGVSSDTAHTVARGA